MAEAVEFISMEDKTPITYKVGDKVRMKFSIPLFDVPAGTMAKIKKVKQVTPIESGGVYLVAFEPVKEVQGEEPLCVAYGTMLEPILENEK